MAQTDTDSRLRSMTGLSSCEGERDQWRWSAELRAVNGKGLDIRLRIPDWVDGLEAQARARLAMVAKRGNVSLSIKVSRVEGVAAQTLNTAALGQAFAVLQEIENRASTHGLALAPSRAVDILQMRGVFEQAGDASEDIGGLRNAILAQIDQLAKDFDQMRIQEGEVLDSVLAGQLDQIETLTDRAAAQAEARKPLVAETLRDNLRKVMDEAVAADPDRVAQELALLAVKADVTEEIDRLRAHVVAARGLMREGRSVGRKLDFLMQEFNREANTLCAKSQNADLTQTGLALKALIDQMREQVQNVE